ncbi:SMP-30/gluconolactonase/LRE family protein [Rhizobium sp. LEGMi198b]|uniref:SMP-30/gluconolactonase/LRE family protein n=1 Tax=Rhizobium sp. CB3171 TaxID=3039157 RepID=UPI0024B25CE3|nr:SMP-30/gluconolactonase/LRE family protein [Rhizobium sp. CB3171]WFU05329.1 SMP-30/gluconolactonase/LRE family protein [Rhizobium sp. CB3171]
MSDQNTVHILERNFGEMPQGGDTLKDGRFLTVDVMTGEIVAYSLRSGREVISRVTSGPIAILRGSDDAFYLAHTGGVLGNFWAADDQIAPCIQKISPGQDQAETILTEVAGVPLVSPHDIAFGPDGRLYVADSHIWEWEKENRKGEGRIFAINPDGSAELLVNTGCTFPCGLVVEADGAVVWTEAYSDRVRRLRKDGRIEDVFQLPEGHTPHGIRVGEDGTLWIASFGSSSIDEVAPDGSSLISHPVPGHPMHLAFDGDGLLIAAFRAADADNMVGQLLRLHTGRLGASTARGAITLQ